MTDLTAFPITGRWPAKTPDLLQLYSAPTPNGVKVSIMLEEVGIAYEVLDSEELQRRLPQVDLGAYYPPKRIDDPASADIVVGSDPVSKQSARADVLPGAEVGPVGVIRRGLICLSATQAWKIGYGTDSQVQDLRYTLAHEIGHALGLDHPGPHGAVMAFEYSEEFNALQPGDVAGAAKLYGPAPPVGAVASLAE